MILSISDIHAAITRAINAAYRAGNFTRARWLEAHVLELAYLDGATR